ncbi:unnamed protein product [Ectocarpus sp. CCAP 1310/34]|nr:unnamed protein product [Ectocarpus sp. CCAP 1310/34]
MAHQHHHKPKTFFWRRVFDQNLAQAISNAYLLYAAWAGIFATQCTAALEAAVNGAGEGTGDGGEGAGQGGDAAGERAGEGAGESDWEGGDEEEEGAGEGGDATGEGAGEGGEGESTDAPLSKEELEEFGVLLKKCLAMERVTWDQRLSTHLMAKCNVGTLNSGGRRAGPVVPPYDSKGAKCARVCKGGSCGNKTGGRYRSKRTTGVCWCNVCSGSKGKARALHLCHTCKKIPSAHGAAAEAADKKRKYKPIDWAV